MQDAVAMPMDAVAADFMEAAGADLLARWDRHQDFWNARRAAGLDPYNRASTSRIGSTCAALSSTGAPLQGVNFGSQDYLSLSSHPAICAAAVEAVSRWGVHSAGSIALQGGSTPLLALEAELAEMLGYPDATVFPTGWAAGYGVIRALVREGDHIILDSLAHACLQEGAVAATRNIHRVPNCSVEAVERRLARLRAADRDCGILVVTETLFSMDSTVPDIGALQAACRAHGATLLVDIAHDFGAIGRGGRGFLGETGMLGKVDLVIGSFSKTFASNGGFVAGHARGLKQALRVFAGPLLFSNALSPVQASVVLAALAVIRGAEGARRRRRLMSNILHLRAGLTAAGFAVLGQPSPIVPTRLGDMAAARWMTREVMANGALVNLVEHPVVSRNSTRWRLQVMADHKPGQIDRLVAIAIQARAGLPEAAAAAS